MTSFVAVTETVGALKGVADLAKSLVGLRDSSAFQGKIMELQTQIMTAHSNAISAQGDQLTLLQRIRDLEGEVADLKKWDADKENYELAEVTPGVFAYTLKEGVGASGPKHYLCPSCYHHKKTSILQTETRVGSGKFMVCSDCGAELLVFGYTLPSNSQPRPKR